MLTKYHPIHRKVNLFEGDSENNTVLGLSRSAIQFVKRVIKLRAVASIYVNCFKFMESNCNIFFLLGNGKYTVGGTLKLTIECDKVVFRETSQFTCHASD